jgi:hypothetical protein
MHVLAREALLWAAVIDKFLKKDLKGALDIFLRHHVGGVGARQCYWQLDLG